MRCPHGHRASNGSLHGPIAGVLSCYDRIVMPGTIPQWCYAKGMTDYLYQRQIQIFDYLYYLTALGKQVVALGLKLKNLYVIPTLARFDNDLMV